MQAKSILFVAMSFLVHCEVGVSLAYSTPSSNLSIGGLELGQTHDALIQKFPDASCYSDPYEEDTNLLQCDVLIHSPAWSGVHLTVGVVNGIVESAGNNDLAPEVLRAIRAEIVAQYGPPTSRDDSSEFWSRGNSVIEVCDSAATVAIYRANPVREEERQIAPAIPVVSESHTTQAHVLEAGPQLFKDYRYGSMYESYSAQEAYYDCTVDVGDTALCVDGIDFLSNKFDVVLVFSHNKLQTVTLVSEFSNSLYQRVVAALVGKYSLAVLQSSTGQLDLIELRKGPSTESQKVAKVAGFESIALGQGSLSYVFINIEDMPSVTAGNAVELIRQLPEEVRQVVVTVSEDEDGSWLSMSFSLPKLQAKQLEQLFRQPVEDF